MATSTNVSQFFLINVTDTCSVWNVLSSALLFQAAVRKKCQFICAKYVMYECLQKPRSAVSPEDAALQRRLRKEKQRGQFREYEITLADLNDPDILALREKLGKGELATLALAKRFGQAMLTDDQRARRLARAVLGKERVQTTPHLLGWLYYIGELGDSDLEPICQEHERLRGRVPLSPFFREMYNAALYARLMSNTVS